MSQSKSHIKSLLIVASVLTAGYLAWVLIFGASKIDPALQKEAEANSPECGYAKENIEPDRLYSEKEVDKNAQEAKACIDAVIRYIKAKRAAEE